MTLNRAGNNIEHYCIRQAPTMVVFRQIPLPDYYGANSASKFGANSASDFTPNGATKKESGFVTNSTLPKTRYNVQ